MKRYVSALLLLFFSVGVLAQGNRGSISGTVTDASGGVIPGATVAIRNIGTNQTFIVLTSEAGTYSLGNLEPVTYKITVELPGFKLVTVESVKVDTGATANVDVRLEVGTADQTVVVEATAPMINATSPTVGTVITEAMARDLPIMDRSVLSLAQFTPNVGGEVGSEDPEITQGTPNPGTPLNVNGGRPGETAILADGVNNTGISVARQVVSFTPETIQEFTVQTSVFSAEYGGSLGGVVNTTTKSGTNDLHGTASWFVRNPMFNAKDYVIGNVVPPQDNRRDNRFSVTVGGPVKLPYLWTDGFKWYNGHDRTFFFAAFEPYWQKDSQTAFGLLPDAEMRKGDFSNVVNVPGGYVRRDVAQKLGVAISSDLLIYRHYDLATDSKGVTQFTPITLAPGASYPQFPNNVIPQQYLDPVALKFLQYMPMGGEYGIYNGSVVNYFNGRTVENKARRKLLKIDHILTANNRLSFRWTDVPIFGTRIEGGNQEVIVAARASDYSASKQYLLSDTHVFSPRLVNTLSLGSTQGFYDRTVPKEWQTRNLSTEMGLPSGTTWGIPQINTGPFTIGLTGNTNHATLGIQTNREAAYTLSERLVHVKGRMSIKYGVDLQQQIHNTSHIGTFQGGQYTFAGTLTNAGATGGGGTNFATFLLGVPSGIAMRTSVVSYKYVWRNMDAFVQNDWKIRSNLTLNLGVRYSLTLPRVERGDLQGKFDPELTKTLDVPQGQILDSTGRPIANLPAGLLPKQTKVPMYAFAGRGGRSRYIRPVDWNNFGPRVGFAWSPRFLGRRDLVISAGYGLTYRAVGGEGRQPVPDLGGQTTSSYTPTSGAVNPAYILRIGTNVPSYQTTNPLLSIPSDGIVTDTAGIGGLFSLSPNYATPKANSWNLVVQYGVSRDLVIRIAYEGRYANGFFPGFNFNTPDYNQVEQIYAAGIEPNTVSVRDPLGRLNPNGTVMTYPLIRLIAPYMGFGSIDERYDPTARSFTNAGSATLDKRMRGGLSARLNYTFSKTLDDVSNGDGETYAWGRPGTQLGYGASREREYGLAQYNAYHTFTFNFMYDLPIGRGRTLMTSLPGWLDQVIGGWKISGTGLARSGYPIRAVLGDTNKLFGSGNVRPNLNPDAPLTNPDWNPNCPLGASCEPYVNPAAFFRPEKGLVGDSPRANRGYWPGYNTLNLSIQKNFYLNADRSFYLQLRADASNAFNHPIYRQDPNNSANFMTAFPSESDISVSEYNSWANIWNVAHPGDVVAIMPTTSGAKPNADYQKVLNITGGARVNGILSTEFFSIKLPRKFATTPANSYDLRTAEGLKLFRLRNVYNAAEFGQFSRAERMRTILFSLRLVW